MLLKAQSTANSFQTVGVHSERNCGNLAVSFLYLLTNLAVSFLYLLTGNNVVPGDDRGVPDGALR